MKNLTILFVMSLSLSLISCGGGAGEKGGESRRASDFKLQEKETYEPGEYAAQQVLLAYRTKDVDLLKQYASSIMSMALDEDAMDRPDFEEQLDSWDGSIKEVRYGSDEITFEMVYYAYACYMGDPDSDEYIYAVGLKSKDKSTWAITINPLIRMKSASFREKSATIPE